MPRNMIFKLSLKWSRYFCSLLNVMTSHVLTLTCPQGSITYPSSIPWVSSFASLERINLTAISNFSSEDKIFGLTDCFWWFPKFVGSVLSGNNMSFSSQWNNSKMRINLLDGNFENCYSEEISKKSLGDKCLALLIKIKIDRFI